MALTILGNNEFTPSGPARWIPGGQLELDALEIVYQGPYNKLTAFRNSLSKWAASQIDSNMFLEGFPDDGATAWPKVTLRFRGFRNGTLPVGKLSTGTEIQTIAYTVGFDVGSISTGTGGAAGGSASLEIEVIYETPSTTYNWISTKANEGGAVDDPLGDPVIRFWRVGLIDSTAKTGITAAQIAAAVNNRFNKIVLPRRRSEEIVPGKYFLNTLSKTLVFEPR